jgi:hypothetical protein
MVVPRVCCAPPGESRTVVDAHTITIGDAVDAAAWLQSVINEYRGTALIGVAARLRVPDHIAAGHCSAATLASATGTRIDRMRHVLRALVALGLLAETEEGCCASPGSAPCCAAITRTRCATRRRMQAR